MMRIVMLIMMMMLVLVMMKMVVSMTPCINTSITICINIAIRKNVSGKAEKQRKQENKPNKIIGPDNSTCAV